MVRSKGDVPVRSAFQALWFCAAETMTIATLRALHVNLESKLKVSLLPSERAAISGAITELNGLIISRLTQGLRDGHETGF